jgi:hypothetical protein
MLLHQLGNTSPNRSEINLKKLWKDEEDSSKKTVIDTGIGEDVRFSD